MKLKCQIELYSHVFQAQLKQKMIGINSMICVGAWRFKKADNFTRIHNSIEIFDDET